MANVSLSSAISRRRSQCSGRYQLTPMSNVLVSRRFLMVRHMFHCCRRLSIVHPPFPTSSCGLRCQRPCCVSRTLIFVPGDDTTFCGVPGVPVSSHTVELRRVGRERRLGRVGYFLHHTVSLSSGWLGYSLPSCPSAGRQPMLTRTPRHTMALRHVETRQHMCYIGGVPRRGC